MCQESLTNCLISWNHKSLNFRFRLGLMNQTWDLSYWCSIMFPHSNKCFFTSSWSEMSKLSLVVWDKKWDKNQYLPSYIRQFYILSFLYLSSLEKIKGRFKKNRTKGLMLIHCSLQHGYGSVTFWPARRLKMYWNLKCQSEKLINKAFNNRNP